jgi:hypothetical protein
VVSKKAAGGAGLGCGSRRWSIRVHAAQLDASCDARLLNDVGIDVLGGHFHAEHIFGDAHLEHAEVSALIEQVWRRATHHLEKAGSLPTVTTGAAGSALGTVQE